MSDGFKRSFRTPKGYLHETGDSIPSLNGTYIGFVKDNQDADKMGRLRVWIPELSKNEHDPDNWIYVHYCSPFAGASNPRDIKKNGKKLEDTQTSYGWWAVPPDINNEVIVMFINGDPNKGIWIGCLYQQFMNHMVPGIPSSDSFDEGIEGELPPVAEYNKWSEQGNTPTPVRPRYDSLHEGLKNQGLYTDVLRGISSSGARRNPKSDVYGFLSPNGSQMVFDDSPDNTFIRFRTKSGAQIIINDTTGFIYMISKNGNSWMEISDDGVDVYTSQSFSVRAQQDINFHADGNINIHANKTLNFHAGRGESHNVGEHLNYMVGGNLNISSIGTSNYYSLTETRITAPVGLSLSTDGNLAAKGSLSASISTSGTLNLNGSFTKTNVGPGVQPKAAAEASVPKPEDMSDRELNVDNNYEEIETKSIVSRLVTHEPFNLHPSVSSPPVKSAIDSTVSSRIQIDGNAPVVDDNSQSSQQPETSEPNIIQTDNTEFVSPVTGPVTSLFGPRKQPTSGASKNHKGVDVGIPIGTPVVAMRDGTVTYAGWAKGYGNVIYISHDNGYQTRYAHLSSFIAKRGSKVKKGELIAKSGNTGVGSGPHLHFEIRKNGVAINPDTKLNNIKKGSRLTAGKK